jgi:hypothetical protein
MKFTNSILSVLTYGLLAGLAVGGPIERRDRQAVMDKKVQIGYVGDNLWTDGLDSCISITAFGTPDREGGRDKAMVHIGALNQDQNGAVKEFLKEVKKSKMTHPRFTITFPSENWVAILMENDADFAAEMGDGMAERLQQTVNNLAGKAWSEVEKYKSRDDVGGTLRGWKREGYTRYNGHYLYSGGREVVQTEEVTTEAT